MRVLFFGMLKDTFGTGSDALDLPEGSTVADMLGHYAQRFPRLKESLPSIAVAVNQQYATTDTVLRPDDEIALLPPVSGGSGKADGASSADANTSSFSRVAIVREPIDTQAVLTAIKQGDDGAEVIFEGVVRNNTRGRKTLYLDYEAYEVMALREMESLATEARQQFQIRDVAIIHRLGRLQIGETSVLIVVASAHRPAAFDACRWLIDTLKRKVPIWKKEYFVDGVVWADGEPFLDEVRSAR